MPQTGIPSLHLEGMVLQVWGHFYIIDIAYVTVWKEEGDCFNTSIVFRESSEERGMESRGRV